MYIEVKKDKNNTNNKATSTYPVQPITTICPKCENHVTLVPFSDFNLDLVILPYRLGHRHCPNPQCNTHIFTVVKHTDGEPITIYPYKKPKQTRSAPSVVPPDITKEYNEAVAVLEQSTKASAALSRRCLQNLLHNHLNIKKKDLNQEIDELLKTGIPTYLSEAIDAVRNIGNFAAHPIKFQNTGTIADVEPGEAEWSLDVLEMLFDFYFVRPADAKARIDALNQKLQSMGKPKIK